MDFLNRLKEAFEAIPIKTKFLKDLGLNNSYSGFRYFMQDRKDAPSNKLMEKLCDEMDYDYVLVPVKRDEDIQKLKEKIEDQFFEDLDKYLDRYSGDTARTYLKDYGHESSLATALEAFTLEEEVDSKDKIDISDLF